MYCPGCGNADQPPETYCRRCGMFLPDLSKPAKREQTPEQNLKANSVLTLMTVIVSFALAAALYYFLGFRDDTHPLIYATAGMLIAMGAWHIQTFLRTRQLKKQWKRRDASTDIDRSANEAAIATEPTPNLLNPAAANDAVPDSVTDATTKHLDAKLRR